MLERPRAQVVILTVLLAVPLVGVGHGVAGATGRVQATQARTWDPRVLPLVRFVEGHRGMRFKHPVPVHFLSADAFQAKVTTKPASLTRADRAQLDEAANVLRALGLAATDGATLFNQENTLSGATTEAFYDSDRKAVFVNGTSLDLSTRVTVAHELTHALQDQYFNLNRINDRASKKGPEAADAATSVIEGDAVTVEDDYVSSLKQSQQNQYYESQNQQAAAAEGAVSSSVPGVLQALTQSPYDLGPTFIEALLKHGGVSRVNGAFEQPPTLDAQVLNPARYLSGVRAPDVATPRLAAGETRVGSPDSLGALLLYFTLAARLDPATAVQAASAIGADRSVGYRQGGASCLRDRIVASSARGAGVLQATLQRWVAAGPQGSATVDRASQTITFQACEPGSGSLPAESRMTDAETQLGNRAALMSQAIDGGLPVVTAQCAADRLVADPALVPILASSNPTQAQIDQLGGAAQRAAMACGS